MEASFAVRAATQPWGRPDVVLAVSPALLSAASIVARARATKTPVGVIVHDLYGKGVAETGAMGSRAAAWTTHFEAGVLRAATGVAAIHNRFQDELIRVGVSPEKITVIRNWSHIEEDSTDDAVDVRAHYGWADDEILIMHTGNMGVKQGLENVVEAAKIASKMDVSGPPVRFVLIGDGNQRRILAEMAANVPAVQLIEPLPAHEYRRILTAADILLVNERPGICDMAIPSKLTSYFAAGKPVLAATESSSGSAAEVRAAGAGLTVPPGQPKALLNAVRKMYQDENERRAYGLRGQRYAQEVLSSRGAINSYENWCFALRDSAAALSSS